MTSVDSKLNLKRSVFKIHKAPRKSVEGGGVCSVADEKQ